MNNIKLIFIITLLLNVSFTFHTSLAVGSDDTHNHHHSHLKGVGPSEAPHLHTYDKSLISKVSEISKRSNDIPKPISRIFSSTVSFKLEAKELISSLSDGTEYLFWTYNQTIPGPFLRARVGDTVELTLSNHKSSTHPHSIDLHAVTGPGGGANLTQVKPGESKTISFKALHPGVFLYHCASGNVPTHIANGLYGMILIEPKDGLPQVNREFYIMQGEFFTQGLVGERGFQKFSPNKMMKETPEYIVFNGRVKALTGHQTLKAKKGETIRIFFGNAGVSKISSLHIIGEIFDKVYPEASFSSNLTSVQTTLVPAGGATIVELTLENAGNYTILDHALARIDRGAYGILEVLGKPTPELLKQIP
jgi:nitrite reductase (NO-forming)|tara:strand:+ start:186 stop:1274 length:1089 start_codon:yes stop_codon:yes gene_type:complete